jgi:hypothetical protein
MQFSSEAEREATAPGARGPERRDAREATREAGAGSHRARTRGAMSAIPTLRRDSRLRSRTQRKVNF